MTQASFVAVIAFVAFLSISLVESRPACRGPKNYFPKGEKILSPQPYTYLNVGDLPANFTWGNANGKNYLTERKNQHGPESYCGSCWDFASLSSLSDRISIIRNNTWPSIVLAAQVIINCRGGGSCEGGNAGPTFQWIHDNGVPDQTCQAYIGKDGECNAMSICQNCPSSGCYAVTNYTSYWVSEFGSVRGADKMKAEIFARGPIVCGVDATAKLEAFDGQGIFSQFQIVPMLNHDISVVGWGIEDGVEYWVIRNSWGSFYGDKGFFKLKMHSENLGVETDCTWAVPSFTKSVDSKPTMKFDSDVKEPEHIDYFDQSNPCVIRDPALRGVNHITSPLPHEYLSPDDIPASLDWRNYNGVNYVTPLRNQHLSALSNFSYCGSCWAHATSSSLSARYGIANQDSDIPFNLSPQVLINCVTANGTHGCQGGDPTAAFSWIQANGITDDTCAMYEARNLACTDYSICHTCSPNGKCSAISNPPKFFLSQHGQTFGVDQMKAELTRGPMACTIAVTPAFEDYTSGIFVDNTGTKGDMHSIEVVGYGTDSVSGMDYWIIKNSWGSYWGMSGFAYIVRGVDNLGIESQGCDWALP